MLGGRVFRGPPKTRSSQRACVTTTTSTVSTSWATLPSLTPTVALRHSGGGREEVLWGGVWGLGFWDWGLGLRVLQKGWLYGFRVWGLSLGFPPAPTVLFVSAEEGEQSRSRSDPLQCKHKEEEGQSWATGDWCVVVGSCITCLLNLHKGS